MTYSDTPMRNFWQTMLPCGHVVSGEGSVPDRHDCQLEARLSEIERRLGIVSPSDDDPTVGHEPVTT